MRPTNLGFRDYEFESKRIGTHLGPQTYRTENFTMAKLPIRGGPVYQTFHNNPDFSSNTYYYIGHHIIYDEEMGRNAKKLAATQNFRMESP